MHEKGQQVEQDEIEAEMFLTVAKIMFKMITLVLQCVKGLILDAPAMPATGCKRRDIFGGWLDVG